MLTDRFSEVNEIKKNWGWFFALGLLLMLLGVGVVGSSYSATLFSVFVLGVFLFCAGIVQIIQAFIAKKWSGFFLSLMLGILYILIGLFCAARPAVAAVGLTLWIAAFCFVVGVFRMLVALIIRSKEWGWIFFNGLITFILGVLIYSEWPVSGLWIIGLFIGIEMIISGLSWMALSLTAKNT